MNKLTYSSTRSHEATLSFSEAVVKGIAPDGGLYVPSFFPALDILDASLQTLSYQELAKKILALYLVDFTEAEIANCVDSAYDNKFENAEIAPIKTLDHASFIELYHGKTLAFKDMALSILPYLLKTGAEKIGLKEEIVILTATSGDTGKAALEGFADVPGTRIIVFYPTDGVSDVQKRQMTTQEGSNVTVLGIAGNFDDAQNGVKDIFLDEALKSELLEKGYVFSSANSINIGRLLPQIVYYVHAYLALVREGTISNGDPINVAVPTGNFGNILAAYYAKSMGLPIKTFICASNVNHVLTDFIKTGVYDINRPFEITNSPSMDILISSNLERFLYAISGSNTEVLSDLMRGLKTKGKYAISDVMQTNMADFTGGYATDDEAMETIKFLFDTFEYVVDTHTAVAYKVYQDYVTVTGDKTQTLIASTASPFKFSESVAKGLGLKAHDTDSDLGAFEWIEKLAQASKLKVPAPIQWLESKPILHTGTIEKDGLKEAILEVLK